LSNALPRASAVGALALSLLVLAGCTGHTTGATSVSYDSATLTATGRCDSGEKCRFYWEYWKATQPRSSSIKTPVQGPINGATPDVNLSTKISGLTPGTVYRWVICGSPNDGGGYGCTGPRGQVGSTTSDPPSDYGTFRTTAATLAEGWNGTTWSVQATPNPPDVSKALLSGVSCTAASACTAVGSSTTTGDSPLVERWNGTSWAVQASPAVTGSLADVSCTSATACMAVGSRSDHTTLAERWDGTSWTVQTTPNPSGNRFTGLDDVSCTSATACVAVGSSQDLDTLERTPVVERWNGTTWTIQAVPIPSAPSDAIGPSLSGVSCTSATSCVAVGRYFDFSYQRAVLVERWDGASWTIQSTPTPPSGHGELNAVSCTAATACMAVGAQLIGEEADRTSLAERWDGTSWTITPTGNTFSLSDVSCSSATACTATQLQRWNGTSWTVQSPGALAGPYSLSGVSCSSPTTCTAAGYRGSP
jgi:hypothetical protein